MKDAWKIHFQLGDIVRLRKTHPCGSDRWEIVRTGVDFGLTCVGCGHRVLLSRGKFERALKSLWRDGREITAPEPYFPGNQ